MFFDSNEFFLKADSKGYLHSEANFPSEEWIFSDFSSFISPCKSFINTHWQPFTSDIIIKIDMIFRKFCFLSFEKIEILKNLLDLKGKCELEDELIEILDNFSLFLEKITFYDYKLRVSSEFPFFRELNFFEIYKFSDNLDLLFSFLRLFQKILPFHQEKQDFIEKRDFLDHETMKNFFNMSWPFFTLKINVLIENPQQDLIQIYTKDRKIQEIPICELKTIDLSIKKANYLTEIDENLDFNDLLLSIKLINNSLCIDKFHKCTQILSFLFQELDLPYFFGLFSLQMVDFQNFPLQNNIRKWLCEYLDNETGYFLEVFRCFPKNNLLSLVDFYPEIEKRLEKFAKKPNIFIAKILREILMNEKIDENKVFLIGKIMENLDYIVFNELKKFKEETNENSEILNDFASYCIILLKSKARQIMIFETEFKTIPEFFENLLFKILENTILLSYNEKITEKKLIFSIKSLLYLNFHAKIPFLNLLIKMDFFYKISENPNFLINIDFWHQIINDSLYYTTVENREILFESEKNLLGFFKMAGKFCNFSQNKVIFLGNFNLFRKKIEFIQENELLRSIYTDILIKDLVLWGVSSQKMIDDVPSIRSFRLEILISLEKTLIEISNGFEIENSIIKSIFLKKNPLSSSYLYFLAFKYQKIMINLSYIFNTLFSTTYLGLKVSSDLYNLFINVFTRLSSPFLGGIPKEALKNREPYIIGESETPLFRLTSFLEEKIGNLKEKIEIIKENKQIFTILYTPKKLINGVCDNNNENWKLFEDSETENNGISWEKYCVLKEITEIEAFFALVKWSGNKILKNNNENLFEIINKLLRIYEKSLESYDILFDIILDEYWQRYNPIFSLIKLSKKQHNFFKTHISKITSITKIMTEKNRLFRYLTNLSKRILKLSVLNSNIKETEEIMKNVYNWKANILIKKLKNMLNNEEEFNFQIILKGMLIFDELQRIHKYTVQFLKPENFKSLLLESENLFYFTLFFKKINIYLCENPKISNNNNLNEDSIDCINFQLKFFNCLYRQICGNWLLFSTYSEVPFLLFPNKILEIEPLTKEILIFWKYYNRWNEEFPEILTGFYEDLCKNLKKGHFFNGCSEENKIMYISTVKSMGFHFLKLFLVSTYENSIRIRSCFSFSIIHLLSNFEIKYFNDYKSGFAVYFIQILEEHFKWIYPDWKLENHAILNSIVEENKQKLNLIEINYNPNIKNIEIITGCCTHAMIMNLVARLIQNGTNNDPKLDDGIRIMFGSCIATFDYMNFVGNMLKIMGEKKLIDDEIRTLDTDTIENAIFLMKKISDFQDFSWDKMRVTLCFIIKNYCWQNSQQMKFEPNRENNKIDKIKGFVEFYFLSLTKSFVMENWENLKNEMFSNILSGIFQIKFFKSSEKISFQTEILPVFVLIMMFFLEKTIKIEEKSIEIHLKSRFFNHISNEIIPEMNLETVYTDSELLFLFSNNPKAFSNIISRIYEFKQIENPQNEIKLNIKKEFSFEKSVFPNSFSDQSILFINYWIEKAIENCEKLKRKTEKDILSDLIDYEACLTVLHSFLVRFPEFIPLIFQKKDENRIEFIDFLIENIVFSNKLSKNLINLLFSMPYSYKPHPKYKEKLISSCQVWKIEIFKKIKTNIEKSFKIDFLFLENSIFLKNNLEILYFLLKENNFDWSEKNLIELKEIFLYFLQKDNLDEELLEQISFFETFARLNKKIIWFYSGLKGEKNDKIILKYWLNEYFSSEKQFLKEKKQVSCIIKQNEVLETFITTNEILPQCIADINESENNGMELENLPIEIKSIIDSLENESFISLINFFHLQFSKKNPLEANFSLTRITNLFKRKFKSDDINLKFLEPILTQNLNISSFNSNLFREKTSDFQSFLMELAAEQLASNEEIFEEEKKESFPFEVLGFPLNSLDIYKIDENDWDNLDFNGKMELLIEKQQNSMQLIPNNDSAFEFSNNNLPENALELYGIDLNYFNEIPEDCKLEVLEEAKRIYDEKKEIEKQNASEKEGELSKFLLLFRREQNYLGNFDKNIPYEEKENKEEIENFIRNSKNTALKKKILLMLDKKIVDSLDPKLIDIIKKIRKNTLDIEIPEIFKKDIEFANYLQEGKIIADKKSTFLNIINTKNNEEKLNFFDKIDIFPEKILEKLVDMLKNPINKQENSNLKQNSGIFSLLKTISLHPNCSETLFDLLLNSKTAKNDRIFSFLTILLENNYILTLFSHKNLFSRIVSFAKTLEKDELESKIVNFLFCLFEKTDFSLENSNFSLEKYPKILHLSISKQEIEQLINTLISKGIRFHNKSLSKSLFDVIFLLDGDLLSFFTINLIEKMALNCNKILASLLTTVKLYKESQNFVIPTTKESIENLIKEILTEILRKFDNIPSVLHTFKKNLKDILKLFKQICEKNLKEKVFINQKELNLDSFKELKLLENEAMILNIKNILDKDPNILDFCTNLLEILYIFIEILGVEFENLGLTEIYGFFTDGIKTIIILQDFFSPEKPIEEEEKKPLPTLSRLNTKDYSTEMSFTRKLSKNWEKIVINKVEESFKYLYYKMSNVVGQFLHEKNDKISKILISYINKSPSYLGISNDLKFAYLRFQSILSAKKHIKNDEFEEEPIIIKIKRDQIWQSTLEVLLEIPPHELTLRPIKINFDGEIGSDFGGLTREWLSLFTQEIFDPKYGLFQLSANQTAYQPSIYAFAVPDFQIHFRMLGRIIAKALIDNMNLEAHFVKSFLKHMLKKTLYVRDLADIDPDLEKNLEWFLDNSIDEFEFKFCYDINYLGTIKTIDLIENGSNISVTDENKKEYVKLLAYSKMGHEIKRQTEAFLLGFQEIIPSKELYLLDEKDLGLRLSGMPNISLEEMKKYTQYIGYPKDHIIMVWFWEILEEFDENMKANFLFFLSGSFSVPFGGFKDFALKIEKIPNNKEALPVAHTCFNQLDLPTYDSKEIMKEKLLIALTEGSKGFYIG